MSVKSTARHALRQQILTNGFEPIPLAGKACFIDGWSRADINEKWLTEFKRASNYGNTGLRCAKIDDAAGLVAVDIDVDDAYHAEQIGSLADEYLGISNWMRTGGGEKFLLLYWTDEAFRRKRSGKYSDHRVEILCKGSQFVVHGRHPSGVDYTWAGDTNPMECDVDELPVVDEDAVDVFLDEVEAYFEASQFEKESDGSYGLDNEYDYCLTDEDEFEILSPAYGMLSVADIKTRIGSGVWECNLTAIRPDSDSGAGRLSMVHGILRVSDFVTDMTYFEDDSIESSALKLQKIAPDLLKKSVTPLFGDRTKPNDELKALTDKYVLVADGTIRHIDEPLRQYTRQGFGMVHGRKIKSPSTGKPVNIVAEWLQSPHAKKAKYVALLPHTTERFVTDSLGQTVLNSYTPPKHAKSDNDTGIFYTFMQHLVPNETECDLVIDWIAHKLQFPAIRMHGLVMVAPGIFGTGRGTLFDLLTRLIGEAYCVETSLGHLTGSTGQAQYNDYLSQSLMVHIPEAREMSGTVGKWYAASNAYENLKTVVDTAERAMLIRRKTVANVTEKVHASTLIATNHRDGIAIADGDRRLIVVDNGEAMTADMAQQVHAWINDAANVGALYHELRRREVEYTPRGAPMMTEAKRQMIRANVNGPEAAWFELVRSMPGDVVTFGQWCDFADTCRASMDDMEWPGATEITKVLRTIIKARAVPIYNASGRHVQLRVGGDPVRPWAIRNAGTWRLTGPASQDRDTLDGIRAEITKNGTPQGNVIHMSRPDVKK